MTTARPGHNHAMSDISREIAIADTVRWLERAVIGLNLCPFAKAPHVKGQIHYAVSEAKGLEGLRDELIEELQALAALPAEERETVLLIVPHMLRDFLDFNDFLDEADGVLQELDLEGEFQVASFHPDFQFAGTEPDDITNYTNRSPYPTLHLIREASIDARSRLSRKPKPFLKPIWRRWNNWAMKAGTSSMSGQAHELQAPALLAMERWRFAGLSLAGQAPTRTP